MCSLDPKPMGTAVTPDTTKGDCQKTVCDGGGDTTTVADPTDLPNDNHQCTDDTCMGDTPTFGNKPDRSPCTEGGGKLCKAGQCVACILGSDCASGVCTNQSTCAPASCMDMSQNGNETDVDCGGTCSKCINGKKCNSGNDCVSGSCAVTCQPSCSDMMQDQDETGVDCGGSCGPCLVGGGCAGPSDCVSGVCNGTTCGEYQLLVSEARFHGPNGPTDDFVEIYNASPAPALLSADITIDTRSLGNVAFTNKWKGAGQTIPGHGHFLLAGAGYAGTTAADVQLSVMQGGLIGDKGAVVVKDQATILDALCLYCGSGTFDASYLCEGNAFSLTGCTGTTDQSAERKPGGAAGNGTDTGDNSMDFVRAAPANPQDLSSSATP
jgi:hypothetical protein